MASAGLRSANSGTPAARPGAHSPRRPARQPAASGISAAPSPTWRTPASTPIATQTDGSFLDPQVSIPASEGLAFPEPQGSRLHAAGPEEVAEGKAKTAGSFYGFVHHRRMNRWVPFAPEARRNLAELEKDPARRGTLNQVRMTLRLLETHPLNPRRLITFIRWPRRSQEPSSLHERRRRCFPDVAACGSGIFFYFSARTSARSSPDPAEQNILTLHYSTGPSQLKSD